jgi:hypothetical protein
MFSRIGAGEKYLGYYNRELWSATEGDTQGVLVGEAEYRTITTPEGKKQTVSMFKLQGKGSLWMTALGDKLLADKGGTRLEQIGWISWREIKLENGNSIIIIMTKRMGKHDKWAGRYNGIRYLDN